MASNQASIFKNISYSEVLIRKEHQKDITTVLGLAPVLLDVKSDKNLGYKELWKNTSKLEYQNAVKNLEKYKFINQQGLASIFLSVYSPFRQYFPLFVKLPFEAEKSNENIIQALEILRALDGNEIKKIPVDAPTSFVPNFLHPKLYEKNGVINRRT